MNEEPKKRIFKAVVFVFGLIMELFAAVIILISLSQIWLSSAKTAQYYPPAYNYYQAIFLGLFLAVIGTFLINFGKIKRVQSETNGSKALNGIKYFFLALLITGIFMYAMLALVLSNYHD